MTTQQLFKKYRHAMLEAHTYLILHGKEYESLRKAANLTRQKLINHLESEHGDIYISEEFEKMLLDMLLRIHSTSLKLKDISLLKDCF